MLLNVLGSTDLSCCKVRLSSALKFMFLIVGLDFHHIDLLAHFDRERIPERVVRYLQETPYLYG